MSEQSVFVTSLHPGVVNGRFHECMLRLIVENRGNQIAGWAELETGPRIAAARNDLVRIFLEQPSNVKWLLMVDSDMVFPPTLVQDLLAAADEEERPVMGALCFAGGKGRIFPTLYRWEKLGDQIVPYTIESWPEGICEVGATGAACLLIHRGVLALMQDKVEGPAPWFQDGLALGLDCGEDIVFCMRLHAMGVPLHVDTRIAIGHMKPDIYDASAYGRYLAEREKLGGEEGVIEEHRARSHLFLEKADASA